MTVGRTTQTHGPSTASFRRLGCELHNHHCFAATPNGYYRVNGSLWFVNRHFLTYMPLRERYTVCYNPHSSINKRCNGGYDGAGFCSDQGRRASVRDRATHASRPFRTPSARAPGTGQPAAHFLAARSRQPCSPFRSSGKAESISGAGRDGIQQCRTLVWHNPHGNVASWVEGDFLYCPVLPKHRFR